MKSKGPRIDHWETPCFTVPHFEENFCNDFISFFVFVFVFCQNLKQLVTVPRMP